MVKIATPMDPHLTNQYWKVSAGLFGEFLPLYEPKKGHLEGVPQPNP